MIKTLLCLGFLGTALSFPFDGRVVNGTTAKEGEYPYVVSLRSTSGSHSCGASIIAPDWILTAAHCVTGRIPNTTTIQYGVVNISVAGPNIAKVKKIIYHENYNPSSIINDIALLQLETPLKYNYINVAPIQLPPQGYEVPANSQLIGWGLEKTGGKVQTQLQEVNLKCYSDKECQQRHNYRTNKDNICAGVDEGGKGQCSGDSGGPLTFGKYQVGLVSWSVKPCTIAPYPGVYTKVSHYINWINANMKAIFAPV
uniref:Peptidase S1 domain-containing protein n=1 Tax=Megaselia scalaris TaxID=36166 RepID=T1GIM6_MEGSC